MADDAARKEAERQHPSWHDRGVGIGQAQHWRRGFEAGSEWRAAQPVVVTTEQVEAGAHALFLRAAAETGVDTWLAEGAWGAAGPDGRANLRGDVLVILAAVGITVGDAR